MAAEERESKAEGVDTTSDGARRRKPLKADIGHVTEKNIGQLKKLNTATFPVVYKEQFYQDLLKALDYSRLGYYADILVSSICCRLEDRPAGGKALYIMTLSVLKPYQRRGMASQLVRWAIKRAEGKEGQADDVREMYLHVQTSNQSAIEFYRVFGFEITDEIKNYYKKIEPPDCYVLRKPMNGAELAEGGTSQSVVPDDIADEA
eukprot:CAMPEP_0170619502 /NCGR_PEP_ID=MMETSP0224-20130122/27551_1 /TAXON_ID=285029 /ORGANISM="Togula jolla, Strain CCCM 725" /LENGTH=204 /DNA_ID=CAMNT_0010945597 /DNA_START=36 /DNA_END=650 /DNA_ORIENTATION=-